MYEMYTFDYQICAHKNDRNFSSGINANGFFWVKHEDLSFNFMYGEFLFGNKLRNLV